MYRGLHNTSYTFESGDDNVNELIVQTTARTPKCFNTRFETRKHFSVTYVI